MTEHIDDTKPPRLFDDIFINKPCSLAEICIAHLSKNHQIMLYEDADFSQLHFCENIFIPAVLTDYIFAHMILHSELSPEQVLNAFSDSNHCCLQICRLRNAKIRFETLKGLCERQVLKVLELLNVTFTDGNIEDLPQLCGPAMHTFTVSNVKMASKLEPSFRFQFLSEFSHPNLTFFKLVNRSYPWYFLMDRDNPAPLVSLELCGITELSEPTSVMQHTRNYSALYREDPSAIKSIVEETDAVYEEITEEIPRSTLLLRYRLDSMKETLRSLNLFRTALSDLDMEIIFQLKKLHHLDIGYSTFHSDNTITRPTSVSIWEILERLPNLLSLDVSATTIGDELYNKGKSKFITGERSLNRKVPRKLDFLGLSECEGCEVTDIYALASEVSGYQNEHQILVALQRYKERPYVLTTSYNHLYTMHRNSSLNCPNKILKLILEALKRFPFRSNLSLTCTANLFFITRQNYGSYSRSQKNDIVSAIMHCMKAQQSSNLIIRNLLLTLYHFEIPGDFLFEFGLVTRTILETLTIHQDHTEINTLAISLCNTLVCSLKHDMKKEVTDHNFVVVILSVIKRRLDQNLCDEMMEISWSTLWNVSDETPENSWQFIRHDGLQILEDCFETFADHREVQKNMMGLVGNIAEVKELRKYLMKPYLVQLFQRLINAEGQHLEVAYNVCGTLSHLISDGPDAWVCTQPSRDELRRDMYHVIESWDINATRNINYRSFAPILRLVECDVPECIHWALWALCNLSGIDRKYLDLLLRENGKEILSKVQQKIVNNKTLELATIVSRRLDKRERGL